MNDEIQWQFESNNVDWDALAYLYKIAPLGNKTPEGLSRAYSNSMFKCIAVYNGQYVGAGRVLADGVDCAYICDVAIHPEFQGKGLGKYIVSALLNLSRDHKKVILYSVPGKEDFYKKFGFKRMTTAMAIFENQDNAFEMGYIDET